MRCQTYAHRFADIILNSDYALRQEIDEVIDSISFDAVLKKYEEENQRRKKSGKRAAQGKQSTINAIFRTEFCARGWESEKNVFNDPGNDLAIDFWKRKVGVDVAFNHRSYIGGDLLRLQAAAEVQNVINVGVYICPSKEFAKVVSPKDGTTMVVFERSKWYLDNFYPVLTAPVLLVGLMG
ncbi:MAG: restriction endonuclease [Candidatus Delongbacteria bacterium]|nr:restriction endonuclease [Candidatus Delongbacteria bacterium]